MKIAVVKFNTKDKTQFFKVLRKRVNSHFKENKISKYANFEMKFKSFFMIALYFTPLLLMLTGLVSSLWITLILWAIMGIGMSGVGFSIMHDANHGSYSKNKRVNYIMGYFIHFVGGYRKNWQIQHNVLHHSFTNIEGYDDDIKTPLLRMSPDQPQKKMFRYQAYYAILMYGIMTLYWSTAKDFNQLFKYSKSNLLKSQGLSFSKALFEIIFTKTFYYILVLVLPLMLIDLPWYQILLGYVIMHVVCGIFLALVFQPAHVIEETKFYETDENGSIDNNWAIHQMETTSNFAHGSKLLSWFIGGLNYQVEHHLFPNICHVHYKNISKIVKDTAEEFGVPYHDHKTYFEALKSHFSLLNQLGKGTYVRQIA